MKEILKLTFIAVMSITVGQAAKFGSGVLDPELLSFVIGAMTWCLFLRA